MSSTTQRTQVFLFQEVVGEDAFGPVLESRGGREKRLLKTLGLGALGVKAAKAVGTKVVAGSVKALGAKAGAVVKAAAGGALAVKAKALGVKTVTAVAALGLKALIVKLLFGVSTLRTYRQHDILLIFLLFIISIICNGFHLAAVLFDWILADLNVLYSYYK